MLRTLLLFQFVIIALFNTLFANPVDTATAKKVAVNFYLQNSKNIGLTDVNAQLVFVSTNNDLSPQATDSEPVNFYYIFNINKNGFVIVAADDDVKPVLGYSHEGNFIPTNLPEGFNDIMNNYMQQIQYVKQNNLKADNTIQSKWQSYSQPTIYNKQRIIKGGKDSVAPLLTTKWNQSPYFNALCPTNSGGQCVTGCVATAMAQIIKYWNYPASGTGQHTYYHPEYGQLSANFANTTYDWADMPATLGSSSTKVQVNAVATLMFNCGVSMNMDYGPNGSGVPNLDAVIPAYVNYFSFAPTAKFASKYDYTDADWISLLETELNCKRPMQCQGFGPGGGHSWVLDGYDSNDLMHFNWGWGGYDNGYYSVDKLNPVMNGSTENFNFNNKVIMGIQPLTPNNIKLALNSDITVNPDSITYSKPFTIAVNILNNDTADFKGRFAAYLYYKSTYYFLIDSTVNNQQIGKSANQQFTFASNGIPQAVPGIYKVGILYRSVNGNWLTVDSGSFKNFVNVNIVSPASKLKLHTGISFSTNPLIETSPFNLYVRIANYGASFKGNISVVLYSEAGDSLLTLASVSNAKIDSAKFDTLNFNSLVINNIHANYLLGVIFKNSSGNWALVGSGNYTNPIQIALNATPFHGDKYEPDNTPSYAYNLKPVFTNDTTSVNTEGSNINVNGDIDIYKIILSQGYDYIVTAWVDDKDHSTNGQQYTTDLVYAYRFNNFWSDAYYDEQTMNIEVQDGGTVYFSVKNLFASETGTYLLNIYVKRLSDVGIQNLTFSIQHFNIYPNPAKDYLTIQLPASSFQPQASVRIYNSLGKMISTFNIQTKDYILNTKDYAVGIYFLEAIVNDKKYSNKFVISR